MMKIVLSGACGMMGQAVVRTVFNRQDCCISAGIDNKINSNNNSFPIFNSAGKVNVDADVIIDFSNPSLLNSLLNYATYKKLPIIICTTGFSDEQIEKIKKTAEMIPIFFSGNMSMGVNLLIELAKKAASALGSEFDIEIIEKHHNKKVDAPSGTALMIADAIKSTNIKDYEYVYDRHSYRKQRENNEIGIHSVRGGNIVGEHEVIFAGQNETLTLTHSAQSKEIFAAGAINAAKFIVSKSAGLYTMSDLLK